MHPLNFLAFSFRFKSSENKTFIFDIVRKKYIILTPEEWVRQHVIHYLTSIKKYPITLIAIEKQLKINGLSKRTDIVVFNASGNPYIIVECKAPSIKINQETFNQIARYNLKLDANLLMVTNGLEHYYCSVDKDKKQYQFLPKLPDYKN